MVEAAQHPAGARFPAFPRTSNNFAGMISLCLRFYLIHSPADGSSLNSGRHAHHAHVRWSKNRSLTFNQLFLAVKVLKCASHSCFLNTFFTVWTRFQPQHTARTP